MIYQIEMDTDTATLIRHLSPTLKKNVSAALKTIARDPYAGKSLRDELKGMHSYRVRSFRIIYVVDFKKRKISLITIGPRRTVYESLEKEIRLKRKIL